MSDGVSSILGGKQRHLGLNTSTKCQVCCSYCTSNMHNNRVNGRPTVIDEIGIDAYVAVVKRIIDRWSPLMIGLHGPGETLVGPGVNEIVAAALHDASNSVTVQTNMVAAVPLTNLLDSVKGSESRLEFNASYHIGAFLENGQDSLAEAALKNIRRAIKASCPVTVIVPLAPRALSYSDLKAQLLRLKEEGARIHLIPLGGVMKGRAYPASYTDRELELMGALMEAVGTTRDIPLDSRALRMMQGRMRLNGMPCRVGAISVTIGSFGHLWHCTTEPSGADVFGMLQGGIDVESLYADEPYPCPHEACSCKATGNRHCLRINGMTMEMQYAKQLRDDAAYLEALPERGEPE